jgi:hypothetical protein
MDILVLNRHAGIKRHSRKRYSECDLNEDRRTQYNVSVEEQTRPQPPPLSRAWYENSLILETRGGHVFASLIISNISAEMFALGFFFRTTTCR